MWHPVRNVLNPYVRANVAFTFDAIYPRLQTMSDVSGLTAYGYRPVNAADGILGDGQLASIDGPLSDDTITTGYDVLGRALNRSIGAGAANVMSGSFDALGRSEGTTNNLGAFTPGYLSRAMRPDFLDYPNAQRTAFEYHPNAPAGPRRRRPAAEGDHAPGRRGRLDL